MYVRNEYKQLGSQVSLDSELMPNSSDTHPLSPLTSLPGSHTVNRKLSEGKVLVLLQNRIWFIFDIAESSLAIFIKNKNSITIQPFTLKKLIFTFRKNMHKAFIDIFIAAKN